MASQLLKVWETRFFAKYVWKEVKLILEFLKASMRLYIDNYKFSALVSNISQNYMIVKSLNLFWPQNLQCHVGGR